MLTLCRCSRLDTNESRFLHVDCGVYNYVMGSTNWHIGNLKNLCTPINIIKIRYISTKNLSVRKMSDSFRFCIKELFL